MGTILASSPAPRAVINTLPSTTEVDWERLDKTKFFLVGAGLFSAVTGALYPFSVIKTRLQVADIAPSNGSNPSTMLAVVRSIARTEGVLGFYKGFGTVVTGMVPGRFVYMSVLEMTKSGVSKVGRKLELSEATTAGLASGMGGMCASLATQSIIVPMDVISSRLMAQGAEVPSHLKYKGGLDAFRQIVRAEGLVGLYRGFGISILMYAPSSFVWWSTYGASQRVYWKWYHDATERSSLHSSSPARPTGAARNPSIGTIMGIQAMGGLSAAAVSAVVTTPLDTIKTRIQVERTSGLESTITFAARKLMREEGIWGFYRGFIPRWASTSLWGTCMITSYEFLKRLSMRQEIEIQ